MDDSAVRIATHADSWFMSPCAITNLQPRPLCLMPGFEAETLLAVLTTLSVKYELVPYKVWDPGDYKDGWWMNGLFGDLQNRTIDMTGTTWIGTPHRRMNFSISYPVFEIDVVFLTAGADRNLANNAGLLYDVYSNYIWLALLVCSLAYMFVGVVVSRMPHPNFEWSRIVKTSLNFGALIFLNLYACLLLAHLLSLRKSYRIRDAWHMLELIEQKQIQLIVVGVFRYQFMESVNRSNEPFYKALFKALKQNPPFYHTDVAHAVSAVSSGNYVAAGGSTHKAIYKHNNCSIRIIGVRSLPTYSAGFMFRQDSPLLPEFNRALIALQDHTANLYNKYMNWLNTDANIKCGAKEEMSNYNPLGMISLSGGFITLLGVLALCCFALAAECIIGKRRGCRKILRVSVPFVNVWLRTFGRVYRNCE